MGVRDLGLHRQGQEAREEDQAGLLVEDLEVLAAQGEAQEVLNILARILIYLYSIP